MPRPVFVLAIVCALATACSGGGPSNSGANADNPPAAQSATPPAAPAADAPAAAPPAAASEAAPDQAAAAPQPNAKPPARPMSAAPRKAAAAPARGDAAAARKIAAAPEAAEPATPPAPRYREVTIPAGRTIRVTLSTPVASDTSQVEDRVRGTLARAIVVSGTTVVPAGAEVSGTVLEASRSGRVKGRASVVFRFERLNVRDERVEIRTARITRQAEASTGSDVKKGGIGAGVGAIVGGIVGGGKGAAIGAGAGGAGAVLATRGKEIRLPAGTTVATTLQEPLALTVPVVEK